MKYFFLTVLVILLSCKPDDRPVDLIGRDQMVQLLLKIHVLEAKINQIQVVPRDSTMAVYSHYEGILFEDFGVTQDQYERSFNYYVDHPTEFEKIYQVVVDSLMQMEKIGQL